jgi:drug/metabolite transporter (DMT)-like permease
LRSYTKLLLGIIAISLSAILVKWAGVNPTAAAFYRMLYAGLMLLILDRFFRKNRVPNYLWLGPALLAGVSLAADLVIWHKTIFLIGAGPATFLGNSQVLFVSLYAALFYKEKFSPLFIFSAPVVLAGLFLLIPRATSISAGPGFWMGLTVGMTYAGFLLSIRRAHERAGEGYPEILSLGITMLFGSLLVFIYGAFIEHTVFQVPAWNQQAILLLMGVVTQGWVWIKSALNRIPSHQGSLLLLLPPVLTTILGILFFTEPFAATQALGMLLTVGGIALYQWKFHTEP